MADDATADGGGGGILGAFRDVVRPIRSQVLLFGLGLSLLFLILAGAGMTSWAVTIPVLCIGLACLGVFALGAQRGGPRVSNQRIVGRDADVKKSPQKIKAREISGGNVQNRARFGKGSKVDNSGQSIDIEGAAGEETRGE